MRVFYGLLYGLGCRVALGIGWLDNQDCGESDESTAVTSDCHTEDAAGRPAVATFLNIGAHSLENRRTLLPSLIERILKALKPKSQDGLCLGPDEMACFLYLFRTTSIHSDAFITTAGPSGSNIPAAWCLQFLVISTWHSCPHSKC